MSRFALLCLIAACSGPSSSSGGSASPAPAPTPAPTPAPPSVDPARLGTPCGDGGTCTPPMECVKYFGIAGPRGGEFSSCEIRCGEKSACPAGTTCVTVADGPGAVCRPST